MSTKKAETRIIKIAIDKSGADVVKLDSEGYRLSFVDTPEEFRELMEEEVKALRFENQRSYWMAYHALKQRLETESAGGTAVIGAVSPVASSATVRMIVEFVDPDFHSKWLERWIRPDEVREMSYRGYAPMSKKELKSFYSTTPGDVPTIGTGSGGVEMYLWKISLDRKKILDAAEKEQSIGGLSRLKEKVSERLEQIADQVQPREKRGVKVFTEDEDNDGRVWHEEPKAVEESQ